MSPRKPAKLPLMVMPAAEIAALTVAPGTLVQYRTGRFLPDQPSAICTVDGVTPDGVIALSDGQRLHRRDLVFLRLAAPEMRSDHVSHRPGPRGESGEFAEGDPSDPSDPPPDRALAFPRVPSAALPRTGPVLPPRTCLDCGKPYQPTGHRQLRCEPCGDLALQARTKARDERKRAASRTAGKSLKGQHLTDADRDRWLEACHRIHNLTHSGTRQPLAVAQVAPDFPGLKINFHTYHWWARSFRRQGLLLGGRRPAATAGPALVSLPPPDGADEPPPPAPAQATGAAAAAASARADSAAGAPIHGGSAGDTSPRPSETLPATIRDLGKRVRGYAELLDQAADLVAKAEAALSLLDTPLPSEPFTYPTAGE